MIALTIGLWMMPLGCAQAAAGGSASLAMVSVEPASAAAFQPSEQPRLTPDERADIEWLKSILENPANDARTRAGAAVRLIGIGHPLAIEPLVDALRSSDEELKVAVASAINEVRMPPMELLEPAIDGVRAAGGSPLDQLAMALTRYGADAHTRLRAIAHDHQREPEDRLGAIAALGSFRTHDAIEDLVKLLEPQRDEPEQVVVAACRALQHATGMPHGEDAEQWRTWWTEAGDQPPEQWLTNLVQRLSEQLAQAEQKIERERDVTTHVQQRLGQAYRDLFPRLDLDDQFRLLPGLLEESLPTLRDFAVDRIARLLRDSVRVPEEVQHKLADRLNDEMPAIRLQAARLLEQMNYDRLAARLGERLLEETNDELIEGFLDILAKRPGAVALPSIVPLLVTERHGERAAIALWEIVNHESVDAEQLRGLHELAREHEETMRSPAHLRLLARTLPEDELDEIVAVMDGDDAALAAAVAHGLMRRGKVEPLVERAANEAIYPYAARAIARAESPWPAFRQLMTIPPPQTHEAIWREQVVHLSGRLPADRVLEADDLLAAAPGVGADFRLRILQRRLNPNDNGNNTVGEVRAKLTIRLAELLLETDQPQQAVERLEASVEAMAREEAGALHFRAMLRAGQYDRAEQLEPQPAAWIGILERWADRRPDDAIALREEIERRFNGVLNDEMQGQLEAITERLPTAAPDEESGADAMSMDAGEA